MIFWYFCENFISRPEGPPLKVLKWKSTPDCWGNYRILTELCPFFNLLFSLVEIWYDHHASYFENLFILMLVI